VLFGVLPYHNTTIQHQNPEAKNLLTLPVHLLCNTDDETLYSNIRENTRTHPTNWLKQIPQHDGVALICGSGPSLADTIPKIRAMVAAGGKVFALNGAAKFLANRGVMPDYQCIIDARPQTADLVGPAREYLFASQVHPACFAKCPHARLWHPQIENIDDHLPCYEDEFTMIGGAASVGNTATCVAYALGYRIIHCFGYDSSHRDGQSHAFPQPMNVGDPCAWVEFAGKKYLTSLTMKLQAERFQETARALQTLGVKLTVHGTGLLPDMWRTPAVLSEAEKYERMWLHSAYRAVSPGELAVDLFFSTAAATVPIRGRVIDFGCGTGRGAKRIRDAGYDVLLVDFAGNCRDPEALLLPFRKHDLTQPLAEQGDVGYCIDVMEHIPTADVPCVFFTIFNSVPRCFFQISLVDDVCGELIGHKLHLTVKPAAWWIERLSAFGKILLGGCIDGGRSAVFYVERYPPKTKAESS